MRCALGLHLAAAISALSLVFAGQAAAATTTSIVGQSSVEAAGVFCSGDATRLQTEVSSGNSYTVPTAGTITSWSFHFGEGIFEDLDLKVARPVSEGAYLFVGEDQAGEQTPKSLQTYPASIPVEAGDIIGIHYVGAFIPCASEFEDADPGEPSDDIAVFGGDPPLGVESSPEFIYSERWRMALSTTVTTTTPEPLPSNLITLGKPKFNKKNGTAKLPVTVPGAGVLTLTGKGVVKQAKTPTAAGIVKLLVKSKGKKKKALNRTGKAKVKVKITFTPTGGTANSASRKVVLKKRLH